MCRKAAASIPFSNAHVHPIQCFTQCAFFSWPGLCSEWADLVSCLKGNMHAACSSLNLTWEALQKRTSLSFGWLMEVMQDSRCHQTDRTCT